MPLLELLQEYSQNQDKNINTNGEITEENGVFAIRLDANTSILLSEYCDDNDEIKVRIIATLNVGISDDKLLEKFKIYSHRLFGTSFYGKAHLILSEDNTIGLLYEHASASLNVVSFKIMLNKFVAAIMSISKDENINNKENFEILNNNSQADTNNDFKKLIESAGFDLKKLDKNSYRLTVDENTSASLSFHSLSGQFILTTSLELSNRMLAKEFLLLNESLSPGVFFEYENGYLRIIRALDPQKINLEELKNAIKRHKVLLDKTKEYADNYEGQEFVDSNAFGYNQKMV